MFLYICFLWGGGGVRQEAGLRKKSVPKKKQKKNVGEAERCLTRQLHVLVEAGAQHQPFKELQVQEDELGGPKEGRML